MIWNVGEESASLYGTCHFYITLDWFIYVFMKHQRQMKMCNICMTVIFVNIKSDISGIKILNNETINYLTLYWLLKTIHYIFIVQNKYINLF